jgi:biopolymer transport protein ExbD
MKLIIILICLVLIYVIYFIYRGVAEPLLATQVEIEFPKATTSEVDGKKGPIHIFLSDNNYFIGSKDAREQKK